eukprot:GCRY01002263.1.p1 GENE.GCRY01002263.1~~GCRY01002263.1.p1  ORF type:complete len:324 (+),score=65.19 GCRY01002263.1:203-1174(+)
MALTFCLRKCLMLGFFFLSSFAFVDSSQHQNNWAVIVDTSIYYYNYRHAANALAVYDKVKQLGIPDSHILLFLAENVAHEPRNPFPDTVFSDKNREKNLAGKDVEIDFEGKDVTVDTFLRVLLDRQVEDVPFHQRLRTDNSSNILFYLTGHGGDEFLKFQDTTELTSVDLNNAFWEMKRLGRYNEILFIIDTCQAATVLNHFTAPEVFGVGSSLKTENSKSFVSDLTLGTALIDRFTYWWLWEMRNMKPSASATISALISSLHYGKLGSNVGVTVTNPSAAATWELMDFFSARASAARPLPPPPVVSPFLASLDTFFPNTTAH